MQMCTCVGRRGLQWVENDSRKTSPDRGPKGTFSVYISHCCGCLKVQSGFPYPGKAQWLSPFQVASSHLRTPHRYLQTQCPYCRLVFTVLCLSCSSECRDATSPLTISLQCIAAQVPCRPTAAACYFMGCKGEQPCAFSASHEFCETPLLFHCCLFLSPGFWHKLLREIVGSGTNLKPYNLLYLKVPLSSETNSLSIDSVYEPLLLFSPGIPSGSGKCTP